jgi:hypothetical protein
MMQHHDALALPGCVSGSNVSLVRSLGGGAWPGCLALWIAWLADGIKELQRIFALALLGRYTGSFFWNLREILLTTWRACQAAPPAPLLLLGIPVHLSRVRQCHRWSGGAKLSYF